ncbi:hypothetical protein GC176_03485 [bacterium]|nr:hypothetical protein [bacterium]
MRILIHCGQSWRSDVFIVAAILATGMNGCGYPEVSQKTYDVANALFAASNRRSAEHIEKAAVLVSELQAAGEITEREAGWLLEIVEQARSGDWDGAATEARTLIADQVKPAG